MSSSGHEEPVVVMSAFQILGLITEEVVPFDHAPDEIHQSAEYGETFSLDYDGDGKAEREVNAHEHGLRTDRSGNPIYGCWGRSNTAPFAACRAVIGEPGKFLLFVQRYWEENGLISGDSGDTDSLIELRWFDYERGQAGVGWVGSRIDAAQPFNTPLTATTPRAKVRGIGIDAENVLHSAWAEAQFVFDATSNTVDLHLGVQWDPLDNGGITLQGMYLDPDQPLEEEWQASTNIPRIWSYREHYDPSKVYFGTTNSEQRSTTDDIVSVTDLQGNPLPSDARGQFGGAAFPIDAEPIFGITPVGSVRGTVGLTDVEGYPGWSFIFATRGPLDRDATIHPIVTPSLPD